MTGIETGIAIAGLAASIGGTVLTGVGRAGAAKFASKQAQNQADRERAIAELNAEQFDRDTDRAAARRRALLSRSGARPDTGTGLLLQSDSAANAEFQRQLILAGGETQAGALEAQARLDRARAGRAPAGIALGIGQTLLSGADSFDFGTDGVPLPDAGPAIIQGT